MICYKITVKDKKRTSDIITAGIGYMAIDADFLDSATDETKNEHRLSVAKFVGVDDDEIEAISEEQYEEEMSMLLQDADVNKFYLEDENGEVEVIRSKPTEGRVLN